MLYSRFLKKGKRETKTGYIIYFTHAYTTRVTITVTVHNKGKNKEGKGNSALKGGKRCFPEAKTMLFILQTDREESSSTGNSFLRHGKRMCKSQPEEVHKPNAGCGQAEEKMCTSCNEEKNRRSKNKRGLQTASKRSVCKPLFAFIKTMNYLNG